MHCLTVAVTPDRRLSRAARWGSLRTGWMGSKAMACLIAELSAPLLRRFSLFQVDTRILLAKETNKQNPSDVEDRNQEMINQWLVLTCSTDRAEQGCCVHPERRFQSYTHAHTRAHTDMRVKS